MSGRRVKRHTRRAMNRAAPTTAMQTRNSCMVCILARGKSVHSKCYSWCCSRRVSVALHGCCSEFQTGVTKMVEAVEASRLIVPPLTLIMHCWPPPLQSNSISDPGRTPRLAILAQVCRSPLTEQTRMRRLQQDSVSGILVWFVVWPHLLRHRQRCRSSLSSTLEESSACLLVMVKIQIGKKNRCGHLGSG